MHIAMMVKILPDLYFLYQIEKYILRDVQRDEYIIAVTRNYGSLAQTVSILRLHPVF